MGVILCNGFVGVLCEWSVCGDFIKVQFAQDSIHGDRNEFIPSVSFLILYICVTDKIKLRH